MDIYTPPDCDLYTPIPKVWIYNCKWTEDQIIEAFNALPDGIPEDKNFDVYLYDDSMNDVQWAEGMKHRCIRHYNCESLEFKGMDHIQIVQRIYNEFG